MEYLNNDVGSMYLVKIIGVLTRIQEKVSQGLRVSIGKTSDSDIL